MSIQFPSPASQGDTFTASNGVIYTYDNGGWTANSVSGLDNSYVNISGDTMTGDLTVPSLNGGPLAGFRNQLINGGFRFWQRATTSGADYVADRWRMTGGSGNTYVRQNNNADLAALGFAFGLKNEGPGVTILGQYIELDRNGRSCQFPVGSEWTWSVWSNAEPTTTLIRWSKDDNTTSEVAATPGAWTVIGTQGAFNRYQQTFTIANDPVDSGINSLLVRFNLALNQVVSGCQLEPGPVATPFEHRPIGTELALCQRYYQTLESVILLVRTSNAADRSLRVPRTVTMRSDPTETGSVTNSTSTATLSGIAGELRMYAQATNQAGVVNMNDYTADAEL